MPGRLFEPGAHDLEWRIDNLAVRLSDGLRPLARVAYNYRWSWMRDGDSVFRGHPLAVPPRRAAAVFYGIWPASIVAAGVFHWRRQP